MSPPPPLLASANRPNDCSRCFFSLRGTSCPPHPLTVVPLHAMHLKIVTSKALLYLKRLTQSENAPSLSLLLDQRGKANHGPTRGVDRIKHATSASRNGAEHEKASTTVRIQSNQHDKSQHDGPYRIQPTPARCQLSLTSLRFLAFFKTVDPPPYFPQ